MKTASEYRATAEDASDGRAKHGGGDGCCGVSGRKPPGAERHREDHFLLSSCWQLAMLTINPQSAKPRPHRGPAQAQVEVANKR